MSYAGLIPPVGFQFFSGPGFIVLICSNASNLVLREGLSASGRGLRRSNDADTGGVGLLCTAFTDERGLDVELGLPFGLNVAAKGLGLNSELFGFSLAP